MNNSKNIQSLVDPVIIAQHREFTARCRLQGAIDAILLVLKNHKEKGYTCDQTDAIEMVVEMVERQYESWGSIAQDLYYRTEELSDELFGREHFAEVYHQHSDKVEQKIEKRLSELN